jgi:hypothetical protein
MLGAFPGGYELKVAVLAVIYGELCLLLVCSVGR